MWHAVNHSEQQIVGLRRVSFNIDNITEQYAHVVIWISGEGISTSVVIPIFIPIFAYGNFRHGVDRDRLPAHADIYIKELQQHAAISR